MRCCISRATAATSSASCAAVKNRFGATDEIGVFEMTDRGLAEVPNPSALFLAERRGNVSGSAVFAGLEGTRPVLVEVQALLAANAGGSPRRSVIGWDGGRLAMLLAVLETRCGLRLNASDVYLNIAGGLRIAEPAADLAVAAALASAAADRPTDPGMVYFGEVGLSGEVRQVAQAEARLKEAQKLGFAAACLPRRVARGNRPLAAPEGLALHEIGHLADLVAGLRNGQSSADGLAPAAERAIYRGRMRRARQRELGRSRSSSAWSPSPRCWHSCAGWCARCWASPPGSAPASSRSGRHPTSRRASCTGSARISASRRRLAAMFIVALIVLSVVSSHGRRPGARLRAGRRRSHARRAVRPARGVVLVVVRLYRGRLGGDGRPLAGAGAGGTLAALCLQGGNDGGQPAAARISPQRGRAAGAARDARGRSLAGPPQGQAIARP